MPTALITGGSVGIGAAFAREFAARGHDVVLVARDTDRLATVADRLRSRHGVAVDTIAADLADRAAVARVAARVADQAHPVDVLVNNAGFGVHTALTAPDLSVHERALEVMCRAVLVLGGTAGRVMRQRGSGTIINISSVAGYLAMGGYSAVKAWVTAYSEALAVELSGSGVTVTALCPGFVRTEFHQRANINMSRMPEFGWMDVDDLVRSCLRDVNRGRVLSIPTVRYRSVTALLRHAPRVLVRRISAGVSSARRSDG